MVVIRTPAACRLAPPKKFAETQQCSSLAMSAADEDRPRMWKVLRDLTKNVVFPWEGNNKNDVPRMRNRLNKKITEDFDLTS